VRADDHSPFPSIVTDPPFFFFLPARARFCRDDQNPFFQRYPLSSSLLPDEHRPSFPLALIQFFFLGLPDLFRRRPLYAPRNFFLFRFSRWGSVVEVLFFFPDFPSPRRSGDLFLFLRGSLLSLISCLISRRLFSFLHHGFVPVKICLAVDTPDSSLLFPVRYAAVSFLVARTSFLSVAGSFLCEIFLLFFFVVLSL